MQFMFINTNIILMTLLTATLMFSISIWCITFNLSYIIIFEIFKSSSTVFEFPIIMDSMSLMFSSFVLLISATVINFSSSYMNNEYLNKRFIYLILLFIISMMFLIFALNAIAIMLGWDGLGLTSFILVAYYQNKKTNSASMITALSNRIGDSALLIVIALLIQSNSWNFLYSPLSFFNSTIMFFIIIAAMTKSAQMPFSAWLPAAMAAPTPVSALVHSSTLVTAGIYLLIRFNPIIMKFSLNTPLIFIGLSTSIMASLSGCMENNMKKIVALSTLSQLGIMVATLAMGLNSLAFFHLLTHAIFKALLFIACGKMIHDFSTNQDMRLMGNLMTKTPFTWIILNISNFALCGVPFMAGFYSKDLIYENTLMISNQMSIFIMFSIAISLSTIYSVRMMFSSMMNIPLFTPLSNINENDFTTMKSMKMLAIPAIISGAMISWLMFNKPTLIMLNMNTKVLPIMFLMLCFFMGIVMSITTTKINFIYMYMEPFSQMWFLPTLTPTPSKYLLKNSNVMKQLESGWFEMFFAQGHYNTLMNYSLNITKSQMHQTSTFLTLFMIMILLTMM
uniref:NADH dehydrogenase subunit 5 n=1 Tax=Ichthyoxenos japonensis TaxID=2033261 RepID=UPI000EF2BD83|nr:NADH dehydrogenase subunit 5 [Ichthyoxenos japonensis]ATO58528.1 NADH dehydrogenase subunit 5 [Ichthyoxenos japonensis]